VLADWGDVWWGCEVRRAGLCNQATSFTGTQNIYEPNTEYQSPIRHLQRTTHTTGVAFLVPLADTVQPCLHMSSSLTRLPAALHLKSVQKQF